MVVGIIVGAIVGYVFIGGMIAFIMGRVAKDAYEEILWWELVFAAIYWPCLLLFGLFALPVFAVRKITGAK